MGNNIIVDSISTLRRYNPAFFKLGIACAFIPISEDANAEFGTEEQKWLIELIDALRVCGLRDLSERTPKTYRDLGVLAGETESHVENLTTPDDFVLFYCGMFLEVSLILLIKKIPGYNQIPNIGVDNFDRLMSKIYTLIMLNHSTEFLLRSTFYEMAEKKEILPSHLIKIVLNCLDKKIIITRTPERKISDLLEMVALGQIIVHKKGEAYLHDSTIQELTRRWDNVIDSIYLEIEFGSSSLLSFREKRSRVQITRDSFSSVTFCTLDRELLTKLSNIIDWDYDKFTAFTTKLLRNDHDEYFIILFYKKEYGIFWGGIYTSFISSKVDITASLITDALKLQVEIEKEKFNVDRVIFLHNHPSGTGYLSESDLKLAIEIERNLKDIMTNHEIYDFLVYAGNTTTSFKEALEAIRQIKKSSPISQDEINKVMEEHVIFKYTKYSENNYNPVHNLFGWAKYCITQKLYKMDTNDDFSAFEVADHYIKNAKLIIESDNPISLKNGTMLISPELELYNFSELADTLTQVCQELIESWNFRSSILL